MRTIAILSTILIAGWLIQEQLLYRSATSDALVGAYRSAALTRCSTVSNRAGSVAASTAWATPRSLKLVIGDPDLDVYLWQVNHAMWAARYKHPHLVIIAGDPKRTLMCQYDIRNDTALVRAF
ncbi:MAG: hypothetical protein GC150_00140 [Rhizobiales bacterium]|nr:hypothetical protein [Hyphomicrobiales bacterium]